MKLNDYKETGGNVQKQTHVTFDNPSHPDVEVEGYETKKAQKWFQAAKELQSSEIDRCALVGDFLVAVNDGDIEGFIQEIQRE